MEKFSLCLNGTVHDGCSSLEDYHLEGDGIAIIASLGYVICDISKQLSVTEDETIYLIGKSIKRAKGV